MEECIRLRGLENCVNSLFCFGRGVLGSAAIVLPLTQSPARGTMSVLESDGPGALGGRWSIGKGFVHPCAFPPDPFAACYSLM